MKVFCAIQKLIRKKKQFFMITYNKSLCVCVFDTIQKKRKKYGLNKNKFSHLSQLTVFPEITKNIHTPFFFSIQRKLTIPFRHPHAHQPRNDSK